MGARLSQRFNLAAGNPCAGIPGWIRFQIIFPFMNNYRFANNRIFAAQAELSFPIQLRDPAIIHFNISEVAAVMLGRGWSAMMFVCWIEMRTGRGCVRRGAIAFIVNMKTVLAGFKIFNHPRH